MACLAQLEIAEIRAIGAPNWLPAAGRLIFFFEVEHGACGFGREDKGCFKVIHEVGPAEAMEMPDDLTEEGRFPAYPIRFEPGRSMPSRERILGKFGRLDEATGQALEDALEGMAPQGPAHQMAGYPDPIQGDDMELACQQVMNPQGSIADAASWRLLLQLDSDDDVGMMWCDVGRLYFWIHEKDALAGDFSKVWMEMQYH